MASLWQVFFAAAEYANCINKYRKDAYSVCLSTKDFPLKGQLGKASHW